MSRGRGRVRGMLAATLLCLCSLGTAQAVEIKSFIPPGLESRFGELLDPLNAGLPAGWEWQHARVELDRVVVTFGPAEPYVAECETAPLCLLLLHPSQALETDVPAGDFSIRLGHIEAPHQKLALELAHGLASGLASWGKTTAQPAWIEATPGSERWGVDEWLIGILLWAVLSGLLVLAFLERRILVNPWVAASLAWGACCYGLSLFLVPEAIFHDNHHGYTFLAVAQTDVNPVHIVASSFLEFAQGLQQIFGGGDALFFGVNRALMAFSSVLLGWWVARVTQSRPSGMLAAGMWGLSPMALRLGPTDSLFNFTLVLLLAAALLLARAWVLFGKRQWRGAVHALVAVCMVVLAGETHVPAMLLVPSALFLALALGPIPLRRQRWLLGGSVLLAGALFVPHAVAILQVASESTGPNFIELGNLVTARSWAQRLLWNGDWVGHAVLPLALLGAVALIRSRLRDGLMVLAAWGAMLVPMLSIATCLHLHLVMEVPLVCLTTGLAAHGGFLCFNWVSNRLKGKVAAVVMLCCSAAVVVSVLQPWPILKLMPPGAQEYAFLREFVFPLMAHRPGAHLLVPNSVRTEDSPRMPLPLSWGNQQTPGVVWHSRQSELEGLDPKVERFVYLGLNCIRPRLECETAQAQEECAEPLPPMLADYCTKEVAGLVLVPVAYTKPSSEPEGLYCIGFPKIPLRIGLFRVVGKVP